MTGVPHRMSGDDILTLRRLACLATTIALLLAPAGPGAASAFSDSLRPVLPSLAGLAVTLPGLYTPRAPEPTYLAPTGHAMTRPAPRPRTWHVAPEDLPQTYDGLVRLGSERLCLAVTLYHEARGETRRGRAAVASVIRQRQLTPGRWGDTICAVTRPSQFTFYTGAACRRGGPCRIPPVNDDAAWARALREAALAFAQPRPDPDLAGADHYHAAHILPDWSAAMRRIGRIGDHVFYRDPSSPPALRVSVSTKSSPLARVAPTAPALRLESLCRTGTP